MKQPVYDGWMATRRGRFTAVVLLLAVVLPGSARADTFPPATKAPAANAHLPTVALCPASLVGSLNDYWDRVTGFVVDSLHSRARFIQLSVIAFGIGLFILLRSRPGM